MRNLKRALSLTLASVMLLGMMVVGTSAAAGYDDVAETDNVEAIEVLQAIEVMVGDERGFGPERTVNRAEMAVVMGKLLNLDYNYYDAICPFNDVYDWARGWVGACYANGIVSGRGEGVYDPGTTVTAVEAASMLMRALGYFKYQSDYAEGFEVATVKQAKNIGLFDGVNSSTNAPLTRNQVAQMALNALKSGVVTADGNALNFIDGNGNVIATGGKVNYVYVTSNKSYATAIDDVRASSMGSANDAPIVELGEQLYDGDLKLNDTTDAFGRPARQWEFDAKEIGTYVKKELLKQEYTAEVTGKMLYTLLTKPTIDKYDFTISIDGIQAVEANRAILGEAYFTESNLVNTNTKGIGKTGNGVLTQVFVDSTKDQQEVYIAIINTYLAKAVDDYKTNKEEVDFTVWSVENKGSRSDIRLVKNTAKSEVLTVKNEDILVEDVKEDDIVLVRVAEGEIKEIYDPEVIDKTEISAFKNGDWVNASGTKYDYASSIQYDTEVLDEYDDKNMKDTTYMVYLDLYGYAIGVEIVDDAEDYVFLTGIDLDTSNLYNKTADGNVIHTDGTMETVRINMDNSRNAYNEKFASPSAGNTGVNSLMNTWCTYSVDAKGVYTLTEVANDNYSFTTKFTGDTLKAYTDTEKRQNDKLGQGHNSNAVVLDKAHAGLNGILDNNSGFKTVHANDDSIFLTAKTEYIIATDVLSTTVNKYPSVIINDVDSVDTGIQNVDLKAYTAQQVKDSSSKYANVALEDVSHGVYTLFKDNGYVIAAVVVGEDDGTSSNYAFITGKVKQESYDKEKDEYTWSIDAVVNGAKVVLEEKGSSSSYLKYMEKGEWYEVKYKADGTVRKATQIAEEQANQGSHSSVAYIFCENVDHVASGYPKYIGLMEMKEPSYDAGNNTIVLYQDLTERAHSISAKGRTLQIDTKVEALHRDVTVTSNAKVVLVQDVEKVDNAGNRYGVDIMDRVEECGEGQNGLKKAVDWLEDNNNFYGYVGAVIENGVATSVVIWDRTAYEVNIGGGNRPVTGDVSLVWDEDTQIWTLTVPTSEYEANPSTAKINAWLAKAGCTNISKTRTGWDFTYRGMNHVDQLVNVVPRSAYKITATQFIDGKQSGAPDVYYREAKETFTVSELVDTKDYKFVRITANGHDVTDEVVKGEYSFIVEFDVDVNVYFETTEQPPVGKEVTVTFPEHTSVAVNGTAVASGDKAMTGDTVVVDPIDALDVVGVDEDGKITGDVTVTPKAGFVWSNTFGAWVGADEDGNLNIVPFGVAASMFRIARAASAQEVGPVDTTEDGWFAKMIRDVGSTYTITVGNVVWTATIGSGKTVFMLAEGTSKADAVLAIAQIDTCTVAKIKDSGDEPTPPTPSEGSFVKAEFNPTGADRKIAITEYDKDGKAVDGLTKAEVIAALNETANGVITFAEKDLTLDNTAPTNSNAKDNNGVVWYLTGLVVNTDTGATTPKATQVFKVAYPGGEVYTATSKAVKDVTAGTYALLPSTVLTADAAANGTGAIDVAVTDAAKEGSATVMPTTVSSPKEGYAGYKDVEYVAALQLQIPIVTDTFSGIMADGTIKPEAASAPGLVKVTVFDPTTKLDVNVGSASYIQTGLTATVSRTDAVTKADHAGKSIVLTASGDSVLTINVDQDGKFSEKTFTLPNKIDKSIAGATRLTLRIAVTTPNVPVYLTTPTGTVELERFDNGTPNVPEDDWFIAENIPGKRAVAAKDDEDDVYNKIAENTDNKPTNVKILVSALEDTAGNIQGLSADGKRIDLYTAWSVDTEGGTTGGAKAGAVWKMYTKLTDFGDKEDVDAYSRDYKNATGSQQVQAKAYFPDSMTNKVYIVPGPDDAGVVLSKTGGTSAIGTEKRPILNNSTAGADKNLPGVWQFTVNENIAVADIEALVAIDVTKANTARDFFNASGSFVKINKGESKLFDPNPFVKIAREIPNVTATFEAGKDYAATGASISVEAKYDKSTGLVEVVLTSDKEIAQGAADLDIGTVKLDIGGFYTVNVPMVMAGTTP